MDQKMQAGWQISEAIRDAEKRVSEEYMNVFYAAKRVTRCAQGGCPKCLAALEKEVSVVEKKRKVSRKR